MEIFTPRLILLSGLAATLITSGLAALFLFFSIYRTNKIARGFANTAFSHVLWTLFFFLAISDNTAENLNLIFFKIGLIGLIILPSVFLDLGTYFSENVSNVNHTVFRVVTRFIAFLFLLFILSDLFINTAFISGPLQYVAGDSSWYFLPAVGPLFTSYIIYFFISFTAALLFLFHSLIHAHEIKKSQITTVLLTTLPSIIGGSTLWLPWYGITFYPWGSWTIVIYVLGLFYTITRFHLFNLRVITAEIFTFTIWMFMLGRLLLSSDSSTFILDVGIFMLTIIFGLLTIKSVLNEEKQREDLKDLNLNLEAKVAEQTKEVRQAYEVEKQARAELEKLNEAKNEFILASQHNLRTPITIAKGYVEETESHLKDGKEIDLRSYLDKTKGALETMGQLVNGLIDVTSLEVGKGGMVSKTQKKS